MPKKEFEPEKPVRGLWVKIGQEELMSFPVLAKYAGWLNRGLEGWMDDLISDPKRKQRSDVAVFGVEDMNIVGIKAADKGWVLIGVKSGQVGYVLGWPSEGQRFEVQSVMRKDFDDNRPTAWDFYLLKYDDVEDAAIELRYGINYGDQLVLRLGQGWKAEGNVIADNNGEI